MRWMVRTRRKMMMLRRRILRRETDPKTRKHTLREPVQPKMHMDRSKEPFCVEIYRKNAGPKSSGQHFVRACAVETHMDI